MTSLFLCEKPSQARDIARVLGATRQADGCLRGDGVVVTWCFGHLLEMAPPEHYGEEFKRWTAEALPVVPGQWHMTVKKEARKQFKVISALLGKECAEVVIATDADREGETIAREILDLCGWRGRARRLWLSALDEASIRKALGSMRPGESTEALYRAGLGRARADWLVGMNLTRLYTVIGRHSGHDGVLSVGRVQTPTLRLVVDRDQEIETFRPQPYWRLVATLDVRNGRFQALWVPPEDVADAEGRCINEQAARRLAQRLAGLTGTIRSVDTQRLREAAPLPYDLGTLQQEADRLFGMGAQKVLDTAQSLYETHKAITYPRTDCPYLPLSMHGEASAVLDALVRSDSAFQGLVAQADAAQGSRVWDDARITAHHAIIPTAEPCNVSSMNQDEARIYDLVRRRYVAQFYPQHEYDKTIVVATVDGEAFRAAGRRVITPGWKALFHNPGGEPCDDEPQDQALPAMSRGEDVALEQVEVQTKHTKPPPAFTEGTLIAAMKHAAKHVRDPELRKVLRDSAGLGTEATRAGIIKTLLERGFLEKRKKQLTSTERGRALIAIVPEPVKDPATTALWEQALDDIAQGRMQLAPFLERQIQWLHAMVEQARVQVGQAGAGLPAAETHPCPDCGRPMRRRKGSSGYFWGCTGYPGCRGSLPDARGKPGKPRTSPGKARVPAGSPTGAGQACPGCGKGVQVQRSMNKGKNQGRAFIGCSRFPECKHFQWAREG